MTESPDTLLTVKDLDVYFYTNQRCNKAVREVSFSIRRGRTLGVVGESGCGKSVTAQAIMRLLPQLARIEGGTITYHSKTEGDLRLNEIPANGKLMRELRGKELAMIFQEPMTALNPVYSIGFQIEENLQYHTAMKKQERREKSVELLRSMGIPAPEQRVKEYPHQFSGGMRQRSMIAMAMACNPLLLIADEPTTALDVTIQAQIFELIEELKKSYHTAIMLITHDMGVITELADDVIVMYMGNIVERGTVEDVLRNPAHPYTKALLESIPILGRGKNQKIEPIRGNTPDPYNRPAGCQFAPRCDFATEQCGAMPGETSISNTHGVCCWRHGEKSNA
ncbi:dipeptide/oligopeptide/nickel ABC transporter ATP-binding protein [Spirochaetia bacterium]|nr:dipeptide/oligopeptide/nickel ABC transporter ATP-binding protein [Spirochaetia bacterium]